MVIVGDQFEAKVQQPLSPLSGLEFEKIDSIDSFDSFDSTILICADSLDSSC